MTPSALHLTNPHDVELTEIGPKPGATRGNPVESSAVLFEDALVEVGVWECTPGCFPSRRDGWREAVTIVSGRGVLRDSDGTEHPLAPGVTLALPEGWVGQWDIEETVRKVYVVTLSEPR